MGKIRDYSKPMMVLEKFTPQEFVAGCTDWVVVQPVGSNIRDYSRIDFNNNNQFDYNYNQNYTERGYNFFGNSAAHTVLGGTNEIVEINVYNIDPSKSNLSASQENGHSYTGSEYTLVATRLLKHTYGSTVKYYAIEANGVTYTEKNNS